MATCPNCGACSHTDPTAFTLSDVLVARPPGTWSVGGGQSKVVAYFTGRLACRCGWSILGTVRGDNFHGVASTQRIDPPSG